MKYLLYLNLVLLLINSFNCSFQAKLFNKMNKGKNGENLIISPLSIFQALSLTANGAKGDTLSEMLELLEANSLEKLNKINVDILHTIEKYSTIDIANAVMTRFTPLKSFSEIAEQYSAPIEPLLSVEQVNNWCSNKTHGKIDKIINYLSDETVMMLLNAVYFKGEWILQFEEEITKKLPFYNFGNEEIQVDTMSQIEHFLYYEDKKVQAIQLRFQKDFMSALIILPSSGNDINKYINTLATSKDEYKKIIEGLKMAKVNIQLPKFEVNFSENLNQILSDLGMYNAFSPLDADFTGLRKEGGLAISRVIHKTFLKVNEQGTEAAAVTAIAVDEAIFVDDKIYDMKINRPFLFLLKNGNLPEGNDLLFMSKIEKIE